MWLPLETIFFTRFIWKSGGACLYFENAVTASGTNVTAYNNSFWLKFENLDYDNHCFINNNLFSLGTV